MVLQSLELAFPQIPRAQKAASTLGATEKGAGRAKGGRILDVLDSLVADNDHHPYSILFP
jgi:hypothetical protein